MINKMLMAAIKSYIEIIKGMICNTYFSSLHIINILLLISRLE